MESPSAWKCSSPKRPSSTPRPARLYSTTSSCTRLPTTETPPLPAKRPTLTVPTPTALTQYLNRPKHPRRPGPPWCLSRPNPPSAPRTDHLITTNPRPGGDAHLAVTRHPDATRHPGITLLLVDILPPPAACPPITPPLNTNACPPPPPPPPHLSYADPEVGCNAPAQSALGPGDSPGVDTFVHHPLPLT